MEKVKVQASAAREGWVEMMEALLLNRRCSVLVLEDVLMNLKVFVRFI